MNCDDVRAENLVERYVLGELDDEQQNAFEEHFFSCPDCLEELQLVQAVKSEVSEGMPESSVGAAGPDRPRWFVPATLAASLAAIGVILWALVPGQSDDRNTLLALSAFSPPTYTEAKLRDSLDEAQQQFRSTMSAYNDGDWQTAAEGLEAASLLDPAAANISFFLGISQLLSDQTANGIETLNQTIALGETVYLQEARFYTAKAYLRQADKAAAVRELELVAAMEGRLAGDARTLIQKLNQ